MLGAAVGVGGLPQQGTLISDGDGGERREQRQTDRETGEGGGEDGAFDPMQLLEGLLRRAGMRGGRRLD
jgi:hypothetical protein